MALTKTLELSSGIVIENAYIVINQIYGTKENINYGVYIYLNQQAKMDGKEALTSEIYSFVSDTQDSAKNIFKQCYVNLKLTDKYSDAIDILEEYQTV